MKDNPVVSVIIPIYKVEPYLHECVDSVINQTYKNLEIILVDDGSPDNCPKICDEYALLDSRIKVIHKENGGLSDARNVGIAIAKGKYLCFVDSDDVIHNQMVEIMIKPLIENNVDVSCCSFLLFDDTNLLSDASSAHIIIDDKTYFFLEPKEWFLKEYTASAWNKMYKKELFADIEFPKGKYHEDVFTTYKVCYNTNKIACCKYNLYFYRQRKGSIMKAANHQRLLDLMEGTNELLLFFSNKDRNLFSHLCIFYSKIYCEMQNPRSQQLYTIDTNGFFCLWKQKLDSLNKKDFTLKTKIHYFYLMNFTKTRNFLMNIMRFVYHFAVK